VLTIDRATYDAIVAHARRDHPDGRDEEPVVIYHSHTATEAYPSRTDISYANEPGAHYVLVSTRRPDRVELRSFRIIAGVVTEEEVEIVERYLLGHTPTATVYD
jgi:[CysO sulfur-carrier protein]-S-L-cysteine hydrolase